MAGALLVDMSLPVSDGAVIATISTKRDGKNRATEKTSVSHNRAAISFRMVRLTCVFKLR